MKDEEDRTPNFKIQTCDFGFLEFGFLNFALYFILHNSSFIL